mgnify:CR=1 FL=1
MQINRVIVSAGIAAAIIIGLILLSPQIVPAHGSGHQEKAAVPAGPSPLPVVTIPDPITPEMSRAGPAGPGNFWAKIDPVADISIGRPGNITVRGITNVQPGELLRIDFIVYSMHPLPMEYNPDLWFGDTVNVMKGDGGVNAWSAEIRPEEFKKPDQWQILVTHVQSGWSIGGGSVNVTA